MFSQKQKIAAIIQVIPILQMEAASNSDRVLVDENSENAVRRQTILDRWHPDIRDTSAHMCGGTISHI